MEKKQKSAVESAILISPLILALLWMGFVVFNVNEPGRGMQLSPSRVDGLVTALFIFIIIYAIILFVIFYKMHHSEQQVIEKSPKKRVSKTSKKKKK